MCVGVVWWLFGAPRATQIGEDFQYQASLFSIDNLYNTEQGDFGGELVSISTFDYRTQKSDKGNRLLTNTFTVRTFNGDTIFSVNRYYTIDPLSYAHVPGGAHEARDGTLFAPRFVGKKPFTYWHVNYDAPLTMEFERVEVIDGLKTHVFVSDFVVDQSTELSGLPGVPDERRVQTTGLIRLWIEPLSGYLVKYSDEADVEYTDSQTGVVIEPWNTFRNLYTKQSISHHVEEAVVQKARVVGAYMVIPLLLVGWGLVLVFAGTRRRVRLIGCVVVLVAGGVLYLWQTRAYSGIPVSVGIISWVESPDIRDNINGFKNELNRAGYVEGETITFIEAPIAHADPEVHRSSVEMLQQANVDLIYSLTTPGTLIVQEEIDDMTPIVFSVVTYPVEAGLVESLQRPGKQTTGSRTWVPVEQQIRVFRELVPSINHLAFVYRDGEPNSEIQRANMKRVGALFDIRITPVPVTSISEISTKLSEIVEGPESVNALYAACDTLIQAQGGVAEIITFADQYVLPTMTCNVSGVEEGMLLSIAADFTDTGRVAAEKAIEIFSGVPPSVIEVTTTVRPRMYINEGAADKLGIIIPQELLTSADVIVQ